MRLNKWGVCPVMSLFLILALFVSLSGFEEETGVVHEEHNQHLGFLAGAVYNTHEKGFKLGLGVEYEYVLPFWQELFGIGLAGEVVFDEHKHYVVSLLLPVHLWREFSIFVAPGLLFLDKETVEHRFSVHLGAEYEFELKGLFLAPEFEIAFAGDDVHLMFGVHLGFGF